MEAMMILAKYDAVGGLSGPWGLGGGHRGVFCTYTLRFSVCSRRDNGRGRSFSLLVGLRMIAAVALI